MRLDIISSTTSTRLPYFTAGELKVALGRFASNGKTEWSYDVFPCPVDLCEMLVDLIVIHKIQSNEAGRNEDRIGQARSIMDRLKRWEVSSRGSRGPREHMVEAWRFGIMAYLQRLFPSVRHSTDTGTGTLARRVISLAERIPSASSWSYSLLWPCFQVGVVLEDEGLEEKAWIRSRLRAALSAVGCRHFSNALEALEFAWDNHHRFGSNAIDTFGRSIMLG